jgi:GT2 family glycosyltransferase
MTWSYEIPLRIRPGTTFSVPALEPARTRVVVPTFRDWPDARRTIDSLLACRPTPGEIVLVNDNGPGAVPSWTNQYPIRVAGYGMNRGPAHARNVGVALPTALPFDWILFTDTGCERNPDFLALLSQHSQAQERSCVAISGPVRGAVVSADQTPINYYMTEEGILTPPMQDGAPQAIITANAAVSLAAFHAAGGFDISYPFAAGEDLDLGLKLLRLGPITWAEEAIVEHRFPESLQNFVQRFERYGKGNAHLESRWNLSGMRAKRFHPHDARLQLLADAQVQAMQRGYDSYREQNVLMTRTSEVQA